MGQVADIHGIRRGLVLQLFGDFIEGKASLESVLHKQAMRFEGLDERLDRVEKHLTLALEYVSSTTGKSQS